jgi:hypothetical protein
MVAKILSELLVLNIFVPYEMEAQIQLNEEKIKEQQKINSELADKFQQLEFDKAMMFKENENLKKEHMIFKDFWNKMRLNLKFTLKIKKFLSIKKSWKRKDCTVKNAYKT